MQQLLQVVPVISRKQMGGRGSKCGVKGCGLGVEAEAQQVAQQLLKAVPVIRQVVNKGEGEGCAANVG